MLIFFFIAIAILFGIIVFILLDAIKAKFNKKPLSFRAKIVQNIFFAIASGLIVYLFFFRYLGEVDVCTSNNIYPVITKGDLIYSLKVNPSKTIGQKIIKKGTVILYDNQNLRVVRNKELDSEGVYYDVASNYKCDIIRPHEINGIVICNLSKTFYNSLDTKHYVGFKNTQSCTQN